MQKIHIKNFGAIKEAEIDIDQVLILIGEQASGKSTIAKLIYFFQSLKEDYYLAVLLNNFNKNSQISIESIIESKFSSFYGTIYSKQKFEITFYFASEIKTGLFFRIINTDRGILIKLNESLKVFFNEFENTVNKSYSSAKINAVRIREISESKIILESFSKLHKEVFGEVLNPNDDEFLFVVAGRNATVQYSDLFEKQLYAFVQNKIENSNKQKFKIQEQTVDELLTFKFLEQVSKNRTIFERNGGTFKSLINKGNKTEALIKAEKKIYEILKGDYQVNSGGERILINEDTDVLLSNASSGQQESIRILQDLFLAILKQEKTLRVIEEPEAHLFPIAQKQLVELLALMVNQNEGNTLVITTHSPYILSAFNNLLFAHRVVEKNPDTEADVERIVDKDFRLNPSRFSAYTMRSEEGGHVSESIMGDVGVIKQNYLDTVSDILGSEFSRLLSINSKKFVPK